MKSGVGINLVMSKYSHYKVFGFAGSKKLEEKMRESSLALRFEMAAYFKDMIDNLNYIRYGIFKFKAIFNKHILLKLPIEDGYVILCKGRDYL